MKFETILFAAAVIILGLMSLPEGKEAETQENTQDIQTAAAP